VCVLDTIYGLVTKKIAVGNLEYEVCWRVSEANESQTSYSVEQADIFQYQSYSHSDEMCIILKQYNSIDHYSYIF
jgi:hypothetical protein